jgi:hypothetical protein
MPGIAVYGIAHVQLSIPIGGEDEARSFYGAVLGMPETPKPDSVSDRGGIWFKCDRQEVHCGVESAAPDTRQPRATDGRSGLFADATRAGRLRGRL